MAVVGLAQLSAQDSPATVVQKFHESAKINDERVKVFLELEAKAESGDLEALRQAGEYYHFGRFPVIKNPEKAKILWTKGASLGSEDCASSMHLHAYPNSNETDIIIEKTKWRVIQLLIRQSKSPRRQTEIERPSDVSESSFEEAKSRARSFLSTTHIATASTKSSKNLSIKFRLPNLSSVDDANAFRTNLLTEFRKAQGPIYNNQENAADSHAEAYAMIAYKIKTLQEKGLDNLPAPSSRKTSYNEAAARKIDDLRNQLRNIDIKTGAPFNRKDANNAQVFLDRYRDLLDTIERGL
jgi:hypothetical protein